MEIRKKLLSIRNNDSRISRTGTYVIFQFLERLIPFLVLPILTRLMSPSEYGSYANFQAYLPLVFALFALNADYSVFRNYFELSKYEFSIYVSGSILIVLLASTLFYLVFEFTILNQIIRSQIPDIKIHYFLIYAMAQFIINIRSLIWQAEKNPLFFGLYKMSTKIFQFSLSLILILMYEAKSRLLIDAQIYSLVLFAIIGLVLLSKNKYLRLKIRWVYIKDCLKIGIPLIVHSTGVWLMLLADRIILTDKLGISYSAMLAVGSTIGIPILIFQDSFNKAFIPDLFEDLKNKSQNDNVELVSFTYKYNLILFFASLLVGTSGYFFIDEIFGSIYKEANTLSFLITIAYAFNGMYKMHINYVYFRKKTNLVAIIMLISGLVNIILCYTLVDIVGLVGAGIAVLVGNIIAYLLSWYIGNKMYPLPW